MEEAEVERISSQLTEMAVKLGMSVGVLSHDSKDLLEGLQLITNVITKAAFAAFREKQSAKNPPSETSLSPSDGVRPEHPEAPKTDI